MWVTFYDTLLCYRVKATKSASQSADGRRPRCDLDFLIKLHLRKDVTGYRWAFSVFVAGKEEESCDFVCGCSRDPCGHSFGAQPKLEHHSGISIPRKESARQLLVVGCFWIEQINRLRSSVPLCGFKSFFLKLCLQSAPSDLNSPRCQDGQTWAQMVKTIRLLEAVWFLTQFLYSDIGEHKWI